jgi:hypothetical protein
MADVFRPVGAAISKMIVVTDQTRITAPRLRLPVAIPAPPSPADVSFAIKMRFLNYFFFKCELCFQRESFLAHPTTTVFRLPGNATEKTTVSMVLTRSIAATIRVNPGSSSAPISDAS